MAKKETAESSASSGALFKEELPRKMVFQDVWMNKHETPPKQGRQLEAAEEGTLMGRLASRMAARDMIDELDMGPKGKSPEAKKAQIADMFNDIPSKMMLGAGLHEQTKDLKAFNMSDATKKEKPSPGKNMAEQAKNAGNIFNTMKDTEFSQQKVLKNVK